MWGLFVLELNNLSHMSRICFMAKIDYHHSLPVSTVSGEQLSERKDSLGLRRPAYSLVFGWKVIATLTQPYT